jgi:hypothetical protein
MSQTRTGVPPQPNATRLALTEELIAAGGTDIERWRDPASVSGFWDERAAIAARHIPAGARVLDIGAGAMGLRRFLAPGCIYVPCDVVEREPGALVADLNKGEFPTGEYDWITVLGVFEYLHDVSAALELMAQAAPSAVVTYCLDTAKAAAVRRGMGWVNDYDRDSFVELLARSPWRIRDVTLIKKAPHNEQVMLVLARA